MLTTWTVSYTHLDVYKRQEQLYTLNNKKDKKSEHFTGIGINNVDDRIKLIYGMDYGINIVSEKDKGTTITILSLIHI